MSTMRKMTAEDRPYVLEMMRKFFSSDAVMTNGSEEIFANDIEECISDSINRLEVEEENERAVRAYIKNDFEVIPYLEMIRLNKPDRGTDPSDQSQECGWQNDI